MKKEKLVKNFTVGIEIWTQGSEKGLSFRGGKLKQLW